MGNRSSEEHLSPSALKSALFNLVLCVSLIVSPFPVFAQGEGDSTDDSQILPISDCAHVVGLNRPMHAITPTDQAAQDVLAEVFKVCNEKAACDDGRVVREFEKAVVKKGRNQPLFSNMRRFKGRAKVLLLWSGATIGPGLLVYLLTCAAGMPGPASGLLGTLFGMMGGIIFGRAISPFEKPWGARIERWANKEWNGEDLFSKLQQTITETDRIANGQINNMHFGISRFLKEGARWLAAGNRRNAGMNYAMAVLTSDDLFAGMHLEYPVTVRIARLPLRELGLQHISAQDREEVVAEAIRYVETLEPNELREEHDRQKLMNVIGSVVRTWLTYGEHTQLEAPADSLAASVLGLSSVAAGPTAGPH